MKLKHSRSRTMLLVLKISCVSVLFLSSIAHCNEIIINLHTAPPSTQQSQKHISQSHESGPSLASSPSNDFSSIQGSSSEIHTVESRGDHHNYYDEHPQQSPAKYYHYGEGDEQIQQPQLKKHQSQQQHKIPYHMRPQSSKYTEQSYNEQSSQYPQNGHSYEDDHNHKSHGSYDDEYSSPNYKSAPTEYEERKDNQYHDFGNGQGSGGCGDSYSSGGYGGDDGGYSSGGYRGDHAGIYSSGGHGGDDGGGYSSGGYKGDDGGGFSGSDSGYSNGQGSSGGQSKHGGGKKSKSKYPTGPIPVPIAIYPEGSDYENHDSHQYYPSSSAPSSYSYSSHPGSGWNIELGEFALLFIPAALLTLVYMFYVAANSPNNSHSNYFIDGVGAVGPAMSGHGHGPMPMMGGPHGPSGWRSVDDEARNIENKLTQRVLSSIKN